MRVIRHTDADFAAQLREVIAPSSLFDPVIEQRTRAILDDVHARGDAALIELTERFDGAKLAASQFAVTQAERRAASLKADESLRADVNEAEANIAAFAKKSRRKGWEMRNYHGARVGEKFDPFQRVGIYIPGGTAPLVSTALMTITLAKVTFNSMTRGSPSMPPNSAALAIASSRRPTASTRSRSNACRPV